MRFRTKLIPFLLIFSSFILSVLIYDSNEFAQYDNPTNLEKIAITFYDDSIAAEDFTEILQELNSYGFLLERRIIKQDNVDQEFTTHYFSFASMEEYTSLNIDINAADFLENSKHEYDLLSTYLSNNSLYGSYFLYYTSDAELSFYRCKSRYTTPALF